MILDNHSKKKKIGNHLMVSQNEITYVLKYLKHFVQLFHHQECKGANCIEYRKTYVISFSETTELYIAFLFQNVSPSVMTMTSTKVVYFFATVLIPSFAYI